MKNNSSVGRLNERLRDLQAKRISSGGGVSRSTVIVVATMVGIGLLALTAVWPDYRTVGPSGGTLFLNEDALEVITQAIADDTSVWVATEAARKQANGPPILQKFNQDAVEKEVDRVASRITTSWITTGRAFHLSAGDGLSVLDTKDLLAGGQLLHVKVLSGTHKDKTGYVADDKAPIRGLQPDVEVNYEEWLSHHSAAEIEEWSRAHPGEKLDGRIPNTDVSNGDAAQRRAVDNNNAEMFDIRNRPSTRNIPGYDPTTGLINGVSPTPEREAGNPTPLGFESHGQPAERNPSIGGPPPPPIGSVNQRDETDAGRRTGSGNSPPPSAEIVMNLATAAKVVSHQLRLQDTGSLDELMPMYADQVEYFGRQLDREGVRSEKRDYQAKWPTRHHELISDVSVEEVVPDNKWLLHFVWSFEVENDVKKITGTSQCAIGIVAANGLRVYLEEGKVATQVTEAKSKHK